MLNFEDLITFEDGSIFGEAPTPTGPQPSKVETSVPVPMTPKGAGSPAISIRALPSIATSSSSSSEHERMEFFPQMARGAEQTSVMSKAQLDTLLSLNENLQQNNKSITDLTKLIQDMKAEKENAGTGLDRQGGGHPTPRRFPLPEKTQKLLKGL